MDNIQFIESTHQYLTEDGRELISVSKFTEKFKEKVDWKTIAKRVAAKLTRNGTPTTVNEVLKKWERKRNISAEVGTLYHSIREQQLLEEAGDSHPKIACPIVDGNKWSLPIQELQNNTIYPELMIYDFDYMICGQSDKVIVEGNKIHIWDYKTDQEISLKGWSNEWTSPKKYLPPIQHLEECNGNTYALKMSLYMYMLWKANKGRFKPGDIVIEHITLKRDPLDDNIPVLNQEGVPIEEGRKLIHLPYLKKEVMAMLKTLT